MRLTKELSRQRWSEIRDLCREWDPIGVMQMQQLQLTHYMDRGVKADEI